MRNLRLDLCYDGTNFYGWQRLTGESKTIQGKLETALSRILEEPVTVSGSGRTDAGVHAMGQVANFHCENPMPCQTILKELRRYLPQSIGIYSCCEVSARFHARLNAKGKTYCYRIWNSDQPCVFQRRYVHKVQEALDLREMERAAALLLGRHDFSAFCSIPRFQKSTLRTITKASVQRQGNEVVFTISGDGFLYNMVRILAGTLLEVGLGTRQADSIPGLYGGKREQAGPMAPAKGLCLQEVFY